MVINELSRDSSSENYNNSAKERAKNQFPMFLMSLLLCDKDLCLSLKTQVITSLFKVLSVPEAKSLDFQTPGQVIVFFLSFFF